MTPSTWCRCASAASTPPTPPLRITGSRGCARFEPIDAIVIERRNFAVFLRRQTFEPGLAGVHDQRVGSGALDVLRENLQRRFRILLVDADAAFDRDRNSHGRLHRRDAIADQRRLRHQAGAEAAVLHAVGRAAGIEIDFVEAEIGADPRAGRERARIGAAELQGERMLGRIEAQQPRAVAVQHRAGGQHLGVKQRAPRQQAMEEPAMPVGPFHHRSDGKSAAPTSQLAPSSLFGAQQDCIASDPRLVKHTEDTSSWANTVSGNHSSPYPSPFQTLCVLARRQLAKLLSHSSNQARSWLICRPRLHLPQEWPRLLALQFQSKTIPIQSQPLRRRKRHQLHRRLPTLPLEDCSIVLWWRPLLPLPLAI